MKKKKNKIGFLNVFFLLFSIAGLGLISGSFQFYLDEAYIQERVVVEEKIVWKEVAVNAVIEGYDFFVKTKDYELLSKLVYTEARGEPIEGQEEVVRVVLNRVYSQDFPNTIQDVIMQSGQFCPAETLETLVMEDSYTEDIENVILSVYAEYALEAYDPEEMALYFVNPKYAAPSAYAWMSRSLNYLRSIGNHEFYQ